VDPGAIGVSGIYEKNITLAMARELKEVLEKNSRYKVYLTRNRDIFIPLRDRVKIARRYDADLFLSIHADSAVNRRASGFSVYTLSEKASDKEAAALAEKENKADIVAGLNFAEHSKEVSDILLNLAQRETLNRSSEFATIMVSEMRKSIHTLDNTHRFAGFAVLKAPDVPSVLVELGYLSNRNEEKMLRQKSYRKKLAVSASKAIDKYFQNMRQAFAF
ncbi:MAG: N-acetylmuramoyl-L-alanine amidase, partial [Alphaproteobacteria bacterium]|nr:N-acetylmuramoyl-L-alanine amidase [Alphaproteobacteria bacterium]